MFRLQHQFPVEEVILSFFSVLFFSQAHYIQEEEIGTLTV